MNRIVYKPKNKQTNFLHSLMFYKYRKKQLVSVYYFTNTASNHKINVQIDIYYMGAKSV